MKKYRLTKIIVKTREIVSISNNKTVETTISTCPMCHTPLADSLQTETTTINTINKDINKALAPANYPVDQD